ncbi:MFS transporter-like protein [Lophium mytilinum]|uniref:MFS transporter-like protein n=1 Tax=Lophium mytilinum TaxID=390894 RepID=A0A6A6RDN6_9PEZI|nr:MFS transporter-like protein [Lophium mytilinum]
MGFGILEDKSDLAHVPGTVLLAEKISQPGDVLAQLKHGSGADAQIVLVPQPSEDPNDPLNWPYWKKLSIVAILVYGSCLCAATVGPLLNASIAVLAMDFKTSFKDITLMSGYQLLAAGCSGPIVSALARKYGKRPVFLASSLFAVIGSIMGSASHSYNTLLAARIVQGFSISAYESIIFSVIPDLFFLHQRGLFTAIVSFTLSAVSNLSSVVAGAVTNNLGWHYLFHLLIVTVGLQLILLYLFVPETTYHRDRLYEVDLASTDNLQELAEAEARHDPRTQKAIQDLKIEKTVTNTSSVPPPKKTFIQELAIFTGTHSDESLIQLVFAPVLCCLNLGVLWVVVVSGTVTSFYVGMAYVAAQIFSFPPYNLTAAGVGYLSLGPFLGGALASIVLGLTNDPLIIWFTKRNKGIFEPEIRLLPIIFSSVGGVGLILYGVLAQRGDNLYLVDFMWGLMLFGAVFIFTSASAYAIDAYRDMSSELFIASMMLKNFLFYAYSYFMNDWAASAGPAQVFEVFGGVYFALALTTIPLYIFGKRYRSFWHRHNLLEMLHVRTHSAF